ncbi:MAG: hypothetical protein CMO29_24050 [Tistrella sp.]|nr:hypothetical protein [Tistrella sp.]
MPGAGSVRRGLQSVAHAGQCDRPPAVTAAGRARDPDRPGRGAAGSGGADRACRGSQIHLSDGATCRDGRRVAGARLRHRAVAASVGQSWGRRRASGLRPRAAPLRGGVSVEAGDPQCHSGPVRPLSDAAPADARTCVPPHHPGRRPGAAALPAALTPEGPLMTVRQINPDVMAFLIGRLSELTGTPPSEIGIDIALIDLGLQSIDAVLLCGEIEDRFRIELDPTTIFDAETLGDFAREVSSRVDGA